MNLTDNSIDSAQVRACGRWSQGGEQVTEAMKVKQEARELGGTGEPCPTHSQAPGPAPPEASVTPCLLLATDVKK